MKFPDVSLLPTFSSTADVEKAFGKWDSSSHEYFFIPLILISQKIQIFYPSEEKNFKFFLKTF